MIKRWVTLPLALIGLVSGCVTQTVKTTAVPTLTTYETELADDEILDIAVAVFDPGIAETDVDENVYPEIRRAEAAFLARELSLVLDDQGVWGASRVVPSSDYISDVLVTGTIKQSDGESLVLTIQARDARGHVLKKTIRAQQADMRTSKHSASNAIHSLASIDELPTI